MKADESVKLIKLEGFWTPQNEEEFDADFQVALEEIEEEFGFSAFCMNGGTVGSADFYQIESKTFSAEKVIGVIHVSFVERLPPSLADGASEKHYNLRYAFELDRVSGELRLGKGFLRT